MLWFGQGDCLRKTLSSNLTQSLHCGLQVTHETYLYGCNTPIFCDLMLYRAIKKCWVKSNCSLLQHPSIFIPILDNFFCFSGSGTIASMLEPHLKNKAGGSQMEVGIAFFIIGGFTRLVQL
jgi:hypothetical protein